MTEYLIALHEAEKARQEQKGYKKETTPTRSPLAAIGNYIRQLTRRR